MFGQAETASQRLTRLAMKRIGLVDHIAFAVKIGLIPPRALDRAKRLEQDRNKSKRVGNWVDGSNAPDFEGTMAMLSEAGLLQLEAEAAWRGISLADAEVAVNALRAEIEDREAAARLDDGEEHPRDEKKSA